jgi:hypothetical protein
MESRDDLYVNALGIMNALEHKVARAAAAAAAAVSHLHTSRLQELWMKHTHLKRFMMTAHQQAVAVKHSTASFGAVSAGR